MAVKTAKNSGGQIGFDFEMSNEPDFIMVVSDFDEEIKSSLTARFKWFGMLFFRLKQNNSTSNKNVLVQHFTCNYGGIQSTGSLISLNGEYDGTITQMRLATNDNARNITVYELPEGTTNKNYILDATYTYTGIAISLN